GINIITPSKYRVKAKCKFFGICGGCKQRDLDYQIQLQYKQEQVEEVFRILGGFSDITCEEIVRADNIFFYRNKMEFSFSDKRWLLENEIKKEGKIDRSFAIGLHIPRIFDKVLDIDECYLQSELSNRILNFSRDFFKQKNIPAYSTKTHTGYLRHLVIKQSHHTNDLMVNLVTASENNTLMKEYTDFLLERVPQISTIINNINLKKASVAIGDYEKIYFGNGFIFDFIGNFRFRISANSFFQTNTLQSEKLYNLILNFAGLMGDEIVYDLYSGAGTITIYISKYTRKVFGFETVESAVNDATINMGLNNIHNIQFIKTDLYKSFLPILKNNDVPKPNAVILDPPRSGMHQNTVNDIIELNPEKIVYVSCNPATQARDIKMFTNSGYKLIKIRPVDMFPHTYHIENVALLIKD
ncbi:MAG TPA: 23S rRNA (uracil(1939)-C(5))-methyltransferase RlmD, partial [Ignavibacteria bacterium]|nr:23S rRNA (uracil(1939)-C(5))-methyltransferase RlmD [Ignavibacteria bacterium]